MANAHSNCDSCEAESMTTTMAQPADRQDFPDLTDTSESGWSLGSEDFSVSFEANSEQQEAIYDDIPSDTPSDGILKKSSSGFSLIPNACKSKNLGGCSIESFEESLTTVDADLSRVTISPASADWLSSALRSPDHPTNHAGIISPSLISPGTCMPLSIPRVTSSGAIDWKLVGDHSGSTGSDEASWKRIPQNNESNIAAKPPRIPGTSGVSSIKGSQQVGGAGMEGARTSAMQSDLTGRLGLAETISLTIQEGVASLTSRVGALIGRSPQDAGLVHEPSVTDIQQESKQQDEYGFLPNAKKAAEGKVEIQKRKAIISPEFVMYGHKTQVESKTSSDAVEPAEGDYKEVRGKRPSKRGPADKESCKCTGGCRNSRCICVASGRVCGISCKCPTCRNPFLPILECGLEMRVFHEDTCFMQNLSKIKNMRQRLESVVQVECCAREISVRQCVPKFTCSTCNVKYTYSWCSGRLCRDEKRPRNHCQICKRCGDHRNKHCKTCDRCYFSGVAEAFKCPTCVTPESVSESERPLKTEAAPSTGRPFEDIKPVAGDHGKNFGTEAAGSIANAEDGQREVEKSPAEDEQNNDNEAGCPVQ